MPKLVAGNGAARVSAERSADDNGREHAGRVVMARMGRLADQDDRSFDIEYRQRHDSRTQLYTRWEMIEWYLRRKGRGDDEHQLQRSVVRLERRAGRSG